MTYHNDIDRFFQTYKRNYQIYCDWNDKIYQTAHQKEWMFSLHRRAKELSRIYQENNDLIHYVLLPFEQDPERFTEDDYETLFNWTRDMYQNDYDDPFILKRFAAVLLQHFEKQPRYDHIAFLYLALGYCYIELSRTAVPDTGRLSVEYYRKLTDLRTHFSDFKEESSRTAIFTAYCNLILVEYSIQNISWQEVYVLFQEFLEFCSQDAVQQCAQKNTRVRDLIDMINSNYRGTVLHYIYQYAPETRDDLKKDKLFQDIVSLSRDFFQNLQKEAPDYPGYSSEQVFYGLQNLAEDGVLTCEEAWRIADRTYHNKVDQSVLQEIDPIGVHINPLFLLLSLLYRTDFPKEQKLELAAGYRQEILSFLRSYPTGIHSYTLNNCLRQFCEDSLLLATLPGQRALEAFVSELMVARHLTTHIHSILVGRLAVLITRYLAEYAPALLYSISVPGQFTIANLSDLNRHRDSLLDFISRASFLHDIGKNGIVDTINTEYRSISDEEFSLIKQHPEIGARFLENIPELCCYREIALGHHKFYDGTFGYPASFDNTASSMRILIDIVTICDTLDAATDHLGRNYHTAKTFSQVRDELIAGAGTRYNPDLSSLIAADPILCEQLAHILEEDRKQVYFEVYGKFFSA